MANDAVVTGPTKSPQEPTAKPNITESPFAVFDPKDIKEAGFKVLLFGFSGVGKTRCASTFPKPLFLDFEGGMASTVPGCLRLPKDPKKKIEEYAQLKQYYEVIRKALASPNCPFQTVVLDSLNEMQEVIMRHVLADYNANRQYDDQPTQSDYFKALRDFGTIVRLFLALPCNVVLICASNPPVEFGTTILPNLTGKKTAVEVMRLVSQVGYVYTTRSISGDKVEYLVSFESTPEHGGKDRYSLNPKPVPSVFSEMFKGRF